MKVILSMSSYKKSACSTVPSPSTSISSAQTELSCFLCTARRPLPIAVPFFAVAGGFGAFALAIAAADGLCTSLTPTFLTTGEVGGEFEAAGLAAVVLDELTLLSVLQAATRLSERIVVAIISLLLVVISMLLAFQRSCCGP